MDINDLIKQLQDIEKKHGNLQVNVKGDIKLPAFDIDLVSLDNYKKPYAVELIFNTGDYFFDS